MIVTPDGQAKLLDFGLARLPGDERLTGTGAQLGTVGYMAPEQARNAHAVDARADVFGLGATLFFALTGQAPVPRPAGVRRPRRRRAGPIRPDVPAGLDAVLSRMMAADPADRYPTAEAVMRALLPYLPRVCATASASRASAVAASGVRPVLHGGPEPIARPTADAAPSRVLIVDDEPDIRRLCRVALVAEGFACDEVGAGPDAVALARQGALRPRAARRGPAGAQRRGSAPPPAPAPADAAPEGHDVLRRGQRRRPLAHARSPGPTTS